jgi:5-methylcytosine-specific restriction endonuclease McrA
VIVSVADLRKRGYDVTRHELKQIWDYQSQLSRAHRRLAQEHAHLLWVAPTRASISNHIRRKVAERCAWLCTYCGIPLTLTTLTIDHVQPIRHGGNDSETNLTAACRPCNSRKKDRAQ